MPSLAQIALLSLMLNPEFSELQIQNPNGTEFVVEARKRGGKGQRGRKRGGSGLR